ncbi:MAG: hypothetical protein Rubg2KO_31890 [Rubricoccaceae bacterium]
MTDISDRLDAYPTLSPQERDEVDAYVAATPEWTAALDEARQLAAILDRHRAGVSRIDVAEAVAGESLGQTVDADVADALASNPSLHAHADTVRQRVAELAAGMEDPAAQFERLTGRASASPLTLVNTGAIPFPDRRADDRAPEPTVRPGRMRLAWTRPLATAAALLVVAYSGLLLVSTQTLSDRHRLADLGALSDYEPLRLRGGEADDLDRRLDVVLDEVDDARRSIFGLFPSYNATALDDVAVHLEDIVSAAAPRSSVHEEALFALARVRFAQDQETPARSALTALVEGGGARAPEAQRLLDALDDAE